MRRIKGLNKLLRFAGNEHGGALAELAIIVPFLLVMLAGVSEFGRFFETYTTLAKSSRAAARYLSNTPYDDAHILAAKAMTVCGKTKCATGEQYFANLDAGDVEVTADLVGGKPETVTVSVTGFTYTPIFDIGAILHTDFSLALPIKPSVTMYYMWQEPSGASD